LWFVAANDPEVQLIVQLAQAFFANSDPHVSAQFLRLAGLPADHPETQRILRLKSATRDPGEARPALDIIKKARIPTMIVSGDHDKGIERLSDALASELGSQRAIVAGARHAVPQANGFNGRLMSFLETAERSRPCNAAPVEGHEP
jgi:pimeloyl-ACP methyl ester carboxylesterase